MAIPATGEQAVAAESAEATRTPGTGLLAGPDPSLSRATETGEAKATLAEEYPVNRDPAKLDPEFRQRLEKVVARMEQEFGHRVEMVEGFRTPERQKAIFAQGRTEPGPIATWTTESLHSQGRAADLQVDGKWENPVGYARLQLIAKEEGLRVLGSKDPGHLELPNGNGAGRRARGTLNQGIFRPAPVVSRPARVAQVATTARVARPAQVGWGGGPAPRPVPPAQGFSPAQAVPVEASTPIPTAPEIPEVSIPAPRMEVPERGPIQSEPKAAVTGGSNQKSAVGDLHGEGGGKAATAHPVAVGERAGEASQTHRPARRNDAEVETLDTDIRRRHTGSEPTISSDATRTQGSRSPSPVNSVQRANAAQRVNEILTLSEAWDSQAPGRLHVDLENADGAGTRLRLALRGSELAGTLDLTDPALAGRMRQRIGELHEALSRQGLDSKGIEARAIAGVEGRGAADGDLAALLKDPLAGLARMMDGRNSDESTRSHQQKQARDHAREEFEHFEDPPGRDQNKENQR
jgi:hypothetical protein